jgi:hypothetical protein
MPLAPTRPADQNAGVRKYPTDYRLWGLIFGCLFAPLAAAWLVFEPINDFDRLIGDSMCFAGACVVVAWVLHAIAVVCGVRLTGSADPAQAVDYDDAPPPGT